MQRKAVPFVFQNSNDGLVFLAFEHPLAGRQIVKGGIEANETDHAAARRELREESGLQFPADFEFLGCSEGIVENQEWVFFSILATGLPDTWPFFTQDDGGHIFRFFWQPLNDPLDNKWHPAFHRAVKFVRRLAG